MNNLSPIESSEWFLAIADYVGTDMAWPKLNDVQQNTIDYIRIANQEDYSVEIGHQLLASSLQQELREIESVYQLSHHKLLTQDGFIEALNELPERCITSASDGSVQVNIIGWGQWADFFQRHLCQAIQANFDFLQNKWGVPDDAKTFSAKCNKAFGGLRLYPFVERFNCTDVESYHKSVDDGFKVTVAAPQLTPAQCWDWLGYSVDFAPYYDPNPNPHVNEWHKHNPLPGTVYDLCARLDHPSLIDRPDAVKRFETLHQWAPNNYIVTEFIIKRKYHNHPTYDEAMDLYQGLAPYCLEAIQTVADSVTNQPQQYEKFMLQAAALHPAYYYTLGNYELKQHDEDKTAQYYQKGCDADPDSVRIASYAPWRVRYYLK